MIFFRGKNAKFLTMMMAIAFIIVLAFVSLVKKKDNDSKKVESEPVKSSLENLINRNPETEYPASVREVVKLYCKLIEGMFNETYTEKQFEQLVLQERALFDEDLLKENLYSSFFKKQKSEVDKLRKSGKKLINYQIQRDKEVKYWYNNDIYCASIIVQLNFTGSKLEQSRQQFLLRKDKENKWKIYGWFDVNDSSETPSQVPTATGSK